MDPMEQVWDYPKRNYSHVQFQIRIFSGDIYYVAVREGRPATFTSSDWNVYSAQLGPILRKGDQAQYAGINFCHAPSSLFIGLFGGLYISEYTTRVVEYDCPDTDPQCCEHAIASEAGGDAVMRQPYMLSNDLSDAPASPYILFLAQLMPPLLMLHFF